MASAHPFRLLVFAIFSTLATAASHALQLGETAAQITARHGTAAVEDHGRKLAVYYWEGWSAQIEFKDSAVGKLTYRRNGYLEDAEIQSLLQANGGVQRWRETTSLGTKVRQWVRDDGAVAASDAARPTGMVFQSAGMAPETLTPAESILSDSFLKFDAAANPPASQQPSVTPRDEPIVRSNAPLLRSEPELRTDEPAVENAAPAPVIENPASQETPATITPTAATTEIVRAETRGASGGNGRAIFGILFGVGLIAAGLFYFLARRKPAQQIRPTAPQASAPLVPAAPVVVASDTTNLDSLRDDQIELLVGEIFRRQGYTIELSAALGADGSSDLILRRDGESIPVQSKDWKTSRVTEREVREFYSVMAATAAPRGVLVTTGSIAREARDFAAEKSIELIDGSGLAQRIAAVRRPDENFFDVPGWIDDFTAYARIFDPECPCCTQAMSIRQSRADGSAHWACTSYPRCSGRRETRSDLLMASAAA